MAKNFQNLLMHFLNTVLLKLIFNNHEFKTLTKIFIICKFQNFSKPLKTIIYLMLNFLDLELTIKNSRNLYV